jgi:hypothetical protein
VADGGLTHGDWLERVPQLLNDCAEEWTLRLGEPYPQGAAGSSCGPSATTTRLSP